MFLPILPNPKLWLDFGRKILEFAMNNWKQLMFAGCVSFMFYQNIFETRVLFGIETIPSLKQRLVETEVELNTTVTTLQICNNGNKQLASTIDDRNDEIVKWKNVTERLEGNVQILQGVVTTMNKQTAKDVQDILNQDTPQTCVSAFEYLQKGLKDLKWEN